MTPSEAPKALQASECSEMLDPMRVSCPRTDSGTSVARENPLEEVLSSAAPLPPTTPPPFPPGTVNIPNEYSVLKYFCVYLCMRARLDACVCVRIHKYMEPASRLHAHTHTALLTRGDAVDAQSKLLEPRSFAREHSPPHPPPPSNVVRPSPLCQTSLRTCKKASSRE